MVTPIGVNVDTPLHKTLKTYSRTMHCSDHHRHRRPTSPAFIMVSSVIIIMKLSQKYNSEQAIYYVRINFCFYCVLLYDFYNKSTLHWVAISVYQLTLLVNLLRRSVAVPLVRYNSTTCSMWCICIRYVALVYSFYICCKIWQQIKWSKHDITQNCVISVTL